jgi:hypothetical protein
MREKKIKKIKNMPRVAVGIEGAGPMPTVALGVLPDAVSAPSHRGWSSREAGAYTEGQLDADGSPRRSNLYADGVRTPTAVSRRCPCKAIRRRPRSKALSVGTTVGVAGHSCSE